METVVIFFGGINSGQVQVLPKHTNLYMDENGRIWLDSTKEYLLHGILGTYIEGIYFEGIIRADHVTYQRQSWVPIPRN